MHHLFRPNLSASGLSPAVRPLSEGPEVGLGSLQFEYGNCGVVGVERDRWVSCVPPRGEVVSGAVLISVGGNSNMVIGIGGVVDRCSAQLLTDFRPGAS